MTQRLSTSRRCVPWAVNSCYCVPGSNRSPIQRKFRAVGFITPCCTTKCYLLLAIEVEVRSLGRGCSKKDGELRARNVFLAIHLDDAMQTAMEGDATQCHAMPCHGGARRCKTMQDHARRCEANAMQRARQGKAMQGKEMQRNATQRAVSCCCIPKALPSPPLLLE